MDICFFEFSANIFRLISTNSVFSGASYNTTNISGAPYNTATRGAPYSTTISGAPNSTTAISGAPYSTTISRKLKEEIDKELDLAIEESNTKVRFPTCLNTLFKNKTIGWTHVLLWGH